MSEFISVEIKKSVLPTKRYGATFTRKNGKTKTINFGSINGQTYVDGAGEKIKEDYMARHSIRENWEDPLSAGALSKHILWGDSDNISKNVVAYRKEFGFQ